MRFNIYDLSLSSLFYRSILLLLFFFSNANAIEFSNEEQVYLDRNSIVKVHNETDWPPFNFSENTKPQGISIDVMNRVAEITGLKIDYVSGPSWDEFIDMMGAGQLDVMLNIIDLPERQKMFKFTTPYAKSLTGVFTNKQNDSNFFDFNDLKDKTIAVPAGFDIEINLPKYHPEVKVLPVRDILECIEAIHSGKADAFMEEIGVVDYIISQRMVSDVRLAFQVNEEPFISNLTIATTHENDTLHSIIQKGLNAISGDELNEIRKKWLLQVHEIYEQSMVNLTIPEKEYIYENNTVQICVDPSWPPLDFITKNGEHSGLSADLINKISLRIGTTLKLVPTKTWEQTLHFIQDGQCDIIPLMNETEASQAYINFTQPYFNFATVIVTRDDASFIGDYSQLYGKKVALQAYFFITEYVRANHPEIQIIEVENTQEALKLVSEQKVFATIDGLPAIVNTIETLALENVKIVGSVPQENQMKLGVRKDNELLLSIFSKGVASLTEKEKIGLYRNWFDIEVSNQFLNRSLILKIVTGFSIIFLLLLWRQFTLGKYTRKLKALNVKLHYSSTMDHLTKVFNRKSIEKHLEIEIKRAQLTEEPLTIVFFDIDFFKSVNDTFGHLTGDAVLQQMTALVKKSIRNADHFGRWGGEEFLIVLPNTNHSGAGQLTNNLKNGIESFNFGIDKTITASFGIGQYKDNETPGQLLSRVDDCLYEAKSLGRNTIVNAEEEK